MVIELRKFGSVICVAAYHKIRKNIEYTHTHARKHLRKFNHIFRCSRRSYHGIFDMFAVLSKLQKAATVLY